MQELLALTQDRPEVALDAGEVLLAAGDPAERLYVLVEGRLVVRRDDEDFVVVEEPGACVGEVAVLLGRTHLATVVAVEPSRVRVVEPARAALVEHPEVLYAVAALLADRLDMVKRYLADVQDQYRDVDGGLGMIGDLLRSLSTSPGGRSEPGSEREPDPLY
jgi:CRP/FNR family transcriptional regulator, cyclic AMP receptor protein